MEQRMQQSVTCLEQAIGEFQQRLGNENVLLDAGALAEYERATFDTTQRITLVLFPGDSAEVQDVVRIASHHRWALYPVSRGRNWGLGSRVPAGTNQCIVDLKRIVRASGCLLEGARC